MSMTATAGPPLAAAARKLIEVLSELLTPPLLDPPDQDVPASQVSLVRVTERAVGIGGLRGTETRGASSVMALKGVRLDAIVRFHLWAVGPNEAEDLAAKLHDRLLNRSDQLRVEQGLLRVALNASPPADHVEPVGAWRRAAEYRVLFEYRYADTDGAQGLIARIPVLSELEALGSPGGETTTVTDELVRWDQAAAAQLILRGPFVVGGLTALGFVAGQSPTGTVTLTRTFAGAAGPPAELGTLDALLDAIAGPGPATRHARVRFPSLGAFLAELGTPGEPVPLGDLDGGGEPDLYTPRSRTFDPPVLLPKVADRFTVTFSPAVFDHPAVLYLWARRE